MFGLFDSNIKKIRKLRNDFEDIRQRVLYKMDGYEQYSFASAIKALDEITDRFDELPAEDLNGWRQFGDELLSQARQAWKFYSSVGGMAGEGGRAGTNAFALLSLHASANSFAEAEAKILQTDIKNFEAKISIYLKNFESIDNKIPVD